ncbi:hypothetical protein ACT17R_10435 [Sphingopyxis sp. Q841]|uniref:hypothetical protein n=1 Tax=Sphingopyxis sp. Q841 TaxID=3458250 RepID=UPI004036286E
MKMIPAIVDLEALASKLHKRSGNKKVYGTVQKALLTQACLSDLRLAEALVSQLGEIGISTNEAEFAVKSLSRTALMTTATILYARATATGSGNGERGSVKLSNLNAQEKIDHELLVDIRNGAIAHVRRGENLGDDIWHRNFVFAKQVGDGKWQPAAGSLSIAAHDATIEALRRQIPVAIKLMMAKCQERLEDVQKAFLESDLRREDFREHEVDPTKWFGSMAATERMLIGGPGYEGSTWMPLR